jgi:hypothetical protein
MSSPGKYLQLFPAACTVHHAHIQLDKETHVNENSYRTFKAGLGAFAVLATTTMGFGYLTELNRKDSEFFCNGAPFTIKEGDTLYWITRTHCDGNTMSALDSVVEFYGTTLTVGDTIYLPTHNNCVLRETDGNNIMEDCK